MLVYFYECLLDKAKHNNSLFLLKFLNYFSFQKPKDLMYHMPCKVVQAVVLSYDSLYVFVSVYIS